MNETSDPDARKEALNLIASLHVCTMATCSNGMPHAVSLFYAHDEFDLLWFSDPAARHSRHISEASEPRVAVTVAGDHQDYAGIRGIQMSGIARRLCEPQEVASGLALLTQRYAFLTRILDGPARLADAMRKAAVYRMSPDQVTFIDNTKGFGHKTTFSPDRSSLSNLTAPGRR